ncbi:hypothetical protein ABZ543_12765 [Streptomyces roseifaciens]
MAMFLPLAAEAVEGAAVAGAAGEAAGAAGTAATAARGVGLGKRMLNGAQFARGFHSTAQSSTVQGEPDEPGSTGYGWLKS